jgi:hypothetical protein
VEQCPDRKLTTPLAWLQDAPQNERQKTHEDMRLSAILALMVDGPDAKIALTYAESVFHLCQLNVGLPQFMRILPRPIRSQQITACRM